MRTIRHLLGALLLAALVDAALWGCGRLPSTPVTVPSSVGAGLSQGAGTQSLVSSIGTIADGLVGLIVRTLDLVGSLGGSLANGRWRVVIPPGAVDGDVSIALGVPALTSSQCQLEIRPLDKNYFQVPVTLTIDCSTVPIDQLSTWIIYWYDPSTGQWVPVSGSRVDLTMRTVSAPLLHFSKYAAGPQTKAGWKPTQ